jgi:uroporphyrinogen decarboxylase
MQALTSQQRVQRMFERRDHDRVPRFDHYWPETIRRWQGEGLAGNEHAVWELLQADYCGCCWCWPEVFPGQEHIVEQDEQTKVVRDGHGKLLRHWKNKSGTPEHLGFGCETRQVWEEAYRDRLIQNGVQLDLCDVQRAYRKGREAERWCFLACVEPFEETRALMGDEIALMAMADDPEWVRDVAQTFTDVVILHCDSMMATGIEPDGLWVYGDMAFNHSTVCSPQTYRELIWPEHQRLAQWAHRRGMKCIYHTDGNVQDVIDLYIDAGIDCLQPLEAKAGMDIRALYPRFGDRMAFFGNIDAVIMSTNDRDQIETEIRSKLDAGMVTRGYAYHSDHSVPPGVSWPTYQFIIDLLDRYGNYQ